MLTYLEMTKEISICGELAGYFGVLSPRKERSQ